MPSRNAKPRLFFLIVGALLLYVAFLNTDLSKRGEFWSVTIQNVALIALTIVIVDFLWSIVGGEPVNEAVGELRKTLVDFRKSVRLLDESHKTGLMRIVSTSSNADASGAWMNRIKNAKQSIDLMGYTLHVWTRGERFEETMVSLAENGVNIRLLIMAHDNPSLPAFVNSKIQGLTLAHVQEETKAARQAFKSIAAALQGKPAKGNFEVRVLKTGLIVTQICRTDGILTSIQYLYSAVASRTPLLEVHGEDTGLFQVYLHEFDQLWSLAEPA